MIEALVISMVVTIPFVALVIIITVANRARKRRRFYEGRALD